MSYAKDGIKVTMDLVQFELELENAAKEASVSAYNDGCLKVAGIVAYMLDPVSHPDGKCPPYGNLTPGVPTALDALARRLRGGF